MVRLHGGGAALQRCVIIPIFDQHGAHADRRSAVDVVLGGVADKQHLTGIEPVLERTDSLGSATDYTFKDHELELPELEAGVYLVVGKAGSRHESSIVVVSEIELEVQTTQQGVRVYARTRDGRPAAGARVRVTDGQNLVAQGQTDARGVFDSQAIRRLRGRTLSVVVERDGHYGLFRE